MVTQKCPFRQSRDIGNIKHTDTEYKDKQNTTQKIKKTRNMNPHQKQGVNPGVREG